MSLKTAIANLQKKVLSPNIFGETVTYRPAGGVGRSVVCVIEEDGQQYQGMAGVTLARDEDDATYGGVEEGQLGDTFTRASGEVYGYLGEFSGRDSSMQTLMFQRLDKTVTLLAPPTKAVKDSRGHSDPAFAARFDTKAAFIRVGGGNEQQAGQLRGVNQWRIILQAKPRYEVDETWKVELVEGIYRREFHLSAFDLQTWIAEADEISKKVRG